MLRVQVLFPDEDPSSFSGFPGLERLQTPINPHSSPFTATFWLELAAAVTIVKYTVRSGWIIRTTISIPFHREEC
jgi:hypothetical protein